MKTERWKVANQSESESESQIFVSERAPNVVAQPEQLAVYVVQEDTFEKEGAFSDYEVPKSWIKLASPG